MRNPFLFCKKMLSKIWIFLTQNVSLNKDTAYKRDSSSPSLSRNCCLQDFNQYGGLCEQGEGKAVILFPDILCDVRPLFPATFTKFSPIKLGKPLSYVISFRMQEIGVFSDLENLNLAPTTVPPIARVPLLT